MGGVSRRDQIKLDEAELRELLEEERIAIVSTLGPRGWPHSMPLWFVPREGTVWIWTYAKSQKVRNLERDPRATVLVEAGRAYEELRGAMFEAEAVIHRDVETVLGFAEALTVRYAEASPRSSPTPKRRWKRRRRSGSRSASRHCAPPPGTTASSAAPTSDLRGREEPGLTRVFAVSR